MSPMAQISSVQELKISAAPSSAGNDDVDGKQWLKLVHSFTSARTFCVDGNLATDILCTLRPAEGEHATDATVLPALRYPNVRTNKPVAMNKPSWDALESFTISRYLSGPPIEVVASFKCHICHSILKELKAFRDRLGAKHGCQFLCPYCGDFGVKSGQGRLLKEHVKSKHPEVARKDILDSNPSSSYPTPSERPT